MLEGQVQKNSIFEAAPPDLEPVSDARLVQPPMWRQSGGYGGLGVGAIDDLLASSSTLRFARSTAIFGNSVGRIPGAGVMGAESRSVWRSVGLPTRSQIPILRSKRVAATTERLRGRLGHATHHARSGLSP